MEKGSREYSYLDKIRIYEGIDRCKAVFLQIYKKDRWRAITLINDPRLKFPCLFILMWEIEALQIIRFLNFRNIIALHIINQIQKVQKYKNDEDLLSARKVMVHPILKWILETGYTDDGLSNEYEEILDVTISILINVYKDNSILPIVANVIFIRNKKGHYMHNLIWAFFQSRTPYTLQLIAKYMYSSDQQDVDLACHLLNIEASNSSYQTYIQWLDQNDQFLYFTGECFQYSSNPTLYKVDLERKYLNKGTPSYSRLPVVPEDENEKRHLEGFKTLQNEEKLFLSEYSYRIHERNISEWKRWIDTDIHDQIKIAKMRWGE